MFIIIPKPQKLSLSIAFLALVTMAEYSLDFAKAIAIALPITLLEPVIMATLSFILNIGIIRAK